MIKRVLVALCLLCVVGVIPAMAVTADSSTWGWKWEGDVKPLAAGIMDVSWFGGSPELDYEDAMMGLSTGGTPDTYANISAGASALWYKAPAAAIPAFDMTAGATVEVMWKGHYGTENSGQFFIEFGDGTYALRPTFTYAGALGYTEGLLTINASPNAGDIGHTVSQIYPVWMKHDNPDGNRFFKMRFVVQNGAYDLYVDDVLAASGIADARSGEQAVNNFRFGSKLMCQDWDYIRYTTEGAFAPPIPEPATMVLLSLGGLLLRKKR